jgi:DNA-binding MarR family transcriptional regulator
MDIAPSTIPSRRRSSVLQAMETLRALHEELTPNAQLALLYICENDGMSVSELADMCGFSITTASRASRSLAEAEAPGSLAPYVGLVELRPDPFDARSRLISLTAAGRRLRAALDGLIAEATLLTPVEEAQPARAPDLQPAVRLIA